MNREFFSDAVRTKHNNRGCLLIQIEGVLGISHIKARKLRLLTSLLLIAKVNEKMSLKALINLAGKTVKFTYTDKVRLTVWYLDIDAVSSFQLKSLDMVLPKRILRKEWSILN